jgi:hypothetical protein
LETNINLILQAIEDQNKMHKKSQGIGVGATDTTGSLTARQQLGSGSTWA